MKMKKSITSILNYALKGEMLDEDILSSEFHQILNGKLITLNEYHNGISLLRHQYPEIKLRILSMSESDNNVHSHHIVRAIDSKGIVSDFEVFARYEFSCSKVFCCYESIRELSSSDAFAKLFSFSLLDEINETKSGD